MNYLYAKHFRELKEFQVVRVYRPYRFGGVKSNGKFLGRTFKLVDKMLKEESWEENSEGKRLPVLKDPIGEVIVCGKEKLPDGTKKEVCESIPMENAQKDRRFWDTYKKVFDVVVITPEEVTIDGKTGREFKISRLGFNKVRGMIKSDIDFDVPVEGDHEKFDWEDDVYTNIEGCSYNMKVSGSGLDTEYRFKLLEKKEEKPVDDNFSKEEEEEELPF